MWETFRTTLYLVVVLLIVASLAGYFIWNGYRRLRIARKRYGVEINKRRFLTIYFGVSIACIGVLWIVHFLA